MQEIENGEYIRLNYGKIDKVKNTDYYMQQYIECEKGLYPRENIVKHSKNIIDLIEVGDYVNGYKVLDIINNFVYVDFYNGRGEHKKFADYQIKSLATKQQFESIEYKI